METTPGGLEAYYVLHDHLGSVDRLVRAVGAGSNAIAQRFDPWGKRRNANWTADATDQRYADQQWVERGFTGHEHLDNVPVEKRRLRELNAQGLRQRAVEDRVASAVPEVRPAEPSRAR